MPAHPPPRIAFYISAHGFGHAARQAAIVRELHQRGVQVYIRSAAPQKFFDGLIADYHHAHYDAGIIQHDALSVDGRASLQRYADFLTQQAALIQHELDFVRECGINLIVSDMPPVALDIAAEAGIPGVAITHFTWDWVYEHYLDANPEYRSVVESITASYKRATLALQMPFAHPFPMFSRVEPIALVINPATRSRATVRAELSIPEHSRMALLSMGGVGWGRTDVSALGTLTGWTFLVMPHIWDDVRHLPNVRLIPTGYDGYHNLIAAADVLIGKAGGSTTSECIAHRTPIIYTIRDDYRENSLLRAALDSYAHAHFLDKGTFESGAWVTLLDDFVNAAFDWPPIAINGAEVAADRLLSLL